MKSYVYFYDTVSDNEPKDLFEVKEQMPQEYDYELATLKEVVKQEWADEEDEGRVFVLAEGEYIYRQGNFIKMEG
ncbi:hypothetical protein Q7A53_05740 [Halobacillus rhizosphaerae]|uniref:hypothetical protein n=1 Tax=Halobacillus rhizosphaerae TaxID=3064889 RepID=UPI00398AB9CC